MAPLRYDGASGMLKCDYCGKAHTPESIEQYYHHQLQEAEQAAVDAVAAEAAAAAAGHHDADYNSDEVWDAEQEGMKIYQCPSCGAQLICDATTAATSCPYCGNPSVIPGQFHGILRPDYILPFRLSKDDAVSALKQYYKGKLLLSRKFSDENHLQEIKGIYVPFWLFDGRAVADIHYRATRVMSARHGDEMVTTFDFTELKPFSSAYMPGFFADIYDVGDRESFERARKRGTHSAEQIIDSTVTGYSSVSPTRKQVQMYREKTSYALLPVWMLSTRWNGNNFIFAMNGQTGKFIGDLPVSKGRYFAWMGVIAAPLAALLAILLR